jgi:hypothetical protein
MSRIVRHGIHLERTVDGRDVRSPGSAPITPITRPPSAPVIKGTRGGVIEPAPIQGVGGLCHDASSLSPPACPLAPSTV